MGKKKKFIDKKKSSTFALVYKEEADDGDEEDGAGTGRIFTRVDGGFSHVPGFPETDPRSQQLGYGEQEPEEEVDEDLSVFADAEEDAAEEEEEEEERSAGDGNGSQRQKLQRALVKRQSEASSSRRSRFRGGSGGALPDHVRKELVDLGFPDDGYDYMQHMRKIGAAGVGASFVPTNRLQLEHIRTDVKVYDSSRVAVNNLVDQETHDDFDDDERRQIEAVGSSTRPLRRPAFVEDGLDPDVAAALANSDESQFDSCDELEDDFVVHANENPDDGSTCQEIPPQDAHHDHAQKAAENGHAQKAVEDGHAQKAAENGHAQKAAENAHAQKAAENAHWEAVVEDREEWDDDEEAEEEEDDNDEDVRQIARKDTTQQRRIRLLDEEFESLALREYDDDMFLGEFDEEDPEARGHADISQFDDVLSKFLADSNIHGDKYKTPAETTSSRAVKSFSGPASLGMTLEACRVSSSNASVDDGNGKNEEKARKAPEFFGVHDSTGKESFNVAVHAIPISDTSEDELVIVEEEEECEDERSNWDCETVVSTLSNLDNHPGKIPAPRKSHGKKQLTLGRVLEEKESNGGVIRLRGRHHLPLDLLPEKSGATSVGEKKFKGIGKTGKGDKEESESKKPVSRIGETPEERKARKAALKEQRREARAAKKALKVCYRDESQRAQHGAANTGPSGIHLP